MQCLACRTVKLQGFTTCPPLVAAWAICASYVERYDRFRVTTSPQPSIFIRDLRTSSRFDQKGAYNAEDDDIRLPFDHYAPSKNLLEPSSFGNREDNNTNPSVYAYTLAESKRYKTSASSSVVQPTSALEAPDNLPTKKTGSYQLQSGSTQSVKSKGTYGRTRSTPTTSSRTLFSMSQSTSSRQRFPPMNRETWQIQKDALKTKFSTEGWAPRKRLSPDALEGIRALHAQFPEKYTTPVLADQFEVSAEAIRRVLKSKWRPNDEETASRRTRWDKRGERLWSKMAALGVKPPKKWREVCSRSSHSRLPPSRPFAWNLQAHKELILKYHLSC